MPTITLELPVTGTVVSAGLHAANYADLQTLLNGGLDQDNFAGAFNPGAPVGSIYLWPLAAAPSNHLLLDGAAVSRSSYADLFALIGTTYGAGNGTTTFNVPNAKGRVIVMLDSAQTEFDAMGETGGAKTVALSTGELAAHTHSDGSLAVASHSHGGGVHNHGITAANAGHVHNTEGWTSTVSASWVDYGGGGGYPLFNSVDSHSHYFGPYQSTGEYGGSGASVHNSGAVISAEAPDVSGATGSAGSGTAHNNLQPYLTLSYIMKAL